MYKAYRAHSNEKIERNPGYELLAAYQRFVAI